MTPFDKFLLMLSLFFDLSVFPGFLYAYVELLCFVLSSYCFYTNGGVFYALFCILMFSSHNGIAWRCFYNGTQKGLIFSCCIVFHCTHTILCLTSPYW